ncbi:hypothetical protein [Promicromonospora sp. MEB111]|uniref:pPIWI_RE_Z domain-containing protein n=1 Tax=Promicromonospora sp. MEB111 TaxID=3040301 RepID=UPI0025511637|nr:hypothetical protein [Promicromonospora sp. MEB111]
MRSTSGWSRPVVQALHGWPTNRPDQLRPTELAEVELALYLLAEVDPAARAIDLWPLLSGFPYAQAFVPDLTEETRRRLGTARHYLSGLRRRYVWTHRLEQYLAVDQHFRGYDLDSAEAVPRARRPSLAPDRFDVYERALEGLDPAPGKALPIAGAGEHRFSTGRDTHGVTIPATLAGLPQPARMPFRLSKAGKGEPITVSLSDLREAARVMDAAEAANPDAKPRHWLKSLGEVEMSVASLDGPAAFSDDGFNHAADWELTIDSLFHLVGMVGAGKSTIMHLLTYHCVVELGLKVTIVVGDVAESLRTTTTFNNLQHGSLTAAPIVGRSTRERHLQRLHRRKHSAGAASMLAHSDPAFNYLSSACPIDALRNYEGVEQLRIAEAPCERLQPVHTPSHDDLLNPESATDEPGEPREKITEKKPHGCPLWSVCPRHRAARELLDAPVWVATMPGLLHARVPRHQTDENVRYLEAAADRSDLIIIDEADRVQTQLDTAFAPAETLCGNGDESSWIDWLQRHTISQLTAQGRKGLTDTFVSRWTGSLDVVHHAADRIYMMLNTSGDLRRWVGTNYFSAVTLHQRLYSRWAGPEENRTAEQEADAKFFESVLDAFRDNPIQPVLDRSTESGRLVAELVDLTNMLLTSGEDVARLDACLTELTRGAFRQSSDPERDRKRFALAMLLAALSDQLTVLTNMWPSVEAELSLESAANTLTRRPPKDFEAVMAESPMGNILGFQLTEERPGPPAHSGSLRFFHCNGVGRDLLNRLPELGLSEDVPGPHVMLMSGTSWAGTSTRYHLGLPVNAILRPPQKNVDAVRRTSFSLNLQYDQNGDAIWISGTRQQDRPAAMRALLTGLAVPDPTLAGSLSPLEIELEDLPADRRRLLLLTGSYDEARTVAQFLHDQKRWKDKVTLLIADDADQDDVWYSLRRGDVANYAALDSEILVAPLLAVERGHNIVLDDGTAAIGAVYFLVRPHDKPDDINLAIHAINDWAMRYTRPFTGEFFWLPGRFPTIDAAAGEFRQEARRKWYRYLTRKVAWSGLGDAEKDSFAWDQLVVMWQVIGRLVRGGVEARVRFCDAAFVPVGARPDQLQDTPRTSLLVRFRQILTPYFDPQDTTTTPADKTVAAALLQPFWDALTEINERD